MPSSHGKETTVVLVLSVLVYASVLYVCLGGEEFP